MIESTSELVSIENRGRVRHLVLNRPDKRNAFNHDLILALSDAAQDALEASDVHCVVLRANGPAFSAGIDLFQLGGLADTNQLRPFRRHCIQMANLFEEMPKPVVAQIHGPCLGLGAEVALACDLRVMSEDATFGLPETRLGLIPDVGGSSRLPAVVGLGNAKELIMTGRTIDARECYRIGAANRIAPTGELEAATESLVDELLAASPIAAGLSKRVLDGVAKPTLAASLEQEVTIQQTLVATPDFREAGAAFMEKRTPNWSGKLPGGSSEAPAEPEPVES
jgi:enoyl-CoA hydratase/carnithine racemase